MPIEEESATPTLPVWAQGRDAVADATPAEQWRTKRPNYHLTEITVPKQRTHQLEEGSLDQIVENIVRAFEMEIGHKSDPSTWLTVAGDRFRMNLNGGEWVDGAAIAASGSYNVLIGNSDYYDASEQTFESQHTVFHTALSKGFFWEVLEVLSPPPVVTFRWRHWGAFTGEYAGHAATGETIEMFGVSVARLDDDLKILDLEHYYDPNDLMRPLAHGCPMGH